MKTNPHSRSEQTRRWIIETAAPIFNKKGFAGTSLSDLTAATGLTKGSIYGNFKDKNDVAAHAFQHSIDLIFDYFAGELEAAKTPLDKLLAYPRGFRKIYRMVLAYGGCPIVNTALEADDTHAVLRRMAVDVLARWKASLMTLIRCAKEEGSIDSSVDATTTAEILIALMEGGIVLSKITGEETYFLNTIETAERMISGLQQTP